MHDTSKPLLDILSSYPRGSKELRGLYTKRFTPNDTYQWFASRGVKLKTESDGRMFPVTDDSRTIIDAITNAAVKAGVEVRTKERVDGVEWKEDDEGDDNTEANGGGFAVATSSRSPGSSERTRGEERFDALILATGSFPLGHEIARSLGHKIVDPVPSLFTLDADELVREGGTLHGLSGVSVPMARLTLVVGEEMRGGAGAAKPAGAVSENDSDETPTTKRKRRRKKKAPAIVQEGPLLITHHGVSGPAALRLSAFAAKEFHAANYRCEVKVHFCPRWEEGYRASGGGGGGEGALMDALWETTRSTPKRRVATGCPLLATGDGGTRGGSPRAAVVPRRLWSALALRSGIPPSTTWGDSSKSMIRSLASNLAAFPLRVTSKGVFKEEFVTAGGVSLGEVRMSDMGSRVRPGLFLCGEVLDVDGVTGGFNFMGCWSTGFAAGEGAAEFCRGPEGEDAAG